MNKFEKKVKITLAIAWAIIIYIALTTDVFK